MYRILLKIFVFVLILLLTFQCTFDSPNITNPTPTDTTTQKDTTKPYNPKPANDAVNQPLIVTLDWSAGNVSKFDIYFDTVNPPTTLLVPDVTDQPVVLTQLSYNQTYYWKVISKLSDGSTVEGPVWNFTTMLSPTPSLDGYTLFMEDINTVLPNTVNVLFQVTDLTSQGITNLAADDFEIFEDGASLTPSESELQIKKSDQVPFKIRIVLMLDNSTSLTNDIDQIRLAAENFVRNITPEQEVAIYQFSENPEMLTDFTNDIDSLVNTLQKYQIGFATTDLYGTVIEGASRWEDLYSVNNVLQGTMIIFTDGNDTQGSSTLASALSAVDGKIVYTVGLGTEIQPDILEALGTAGYFPISDSNQLQTKLQTIQEQILDYANSFYLLTYKSPKRGNFNHTLTVRIKNNPHTGDNSFITGTFNSGGFTSQ
ncbi:MAG: VWA domain-containing protein [Bacteroidota bacterium]